MAQRIGQKTVNSFIKGLITEAGEMTFPDGASTDELNCQLNRDGSRSRRLGVAVESQAVTNTNITPTEGEAFNSTLWKNVAGQAGVDWLVIQSGSTVYFYSTAAEPFSGNDTGLSVDLSTYGFNGSVDVAEGRIDTTSINGDLVIVSPSINPIYVEFDLDTESLVVTEIEIKVRDFEWLGDTTTYYSKHDVSVSGTPSVGRQYDTLNAGWDENNNGRTGTALDYYQSQRSSDYPPLTHPWFSGKNSSNEQDVSEFEKIAAGTSLTGNGRYILDFFSKDRSAVSGVAGIDTEIESTRFKAVAAFSGRVFYAGLTSSKNSGKILFSKILDNTSEAGRCYQQNDPTAEYISDLLDTDGGSIVIPDALNIQKLYSLGSSLFVFAENGVWTITGVDGVFRATEYSVQRVTSIGINNSKTFVDVEGVPIWWSAGGIHTLSFEAGTGRPSEQNLSISTIQGYFDEIDNNAKANAHGVYDKTNKRIFWFYPENSSSETLDKQRVLILDIALQAFYPWHVSDDSTNGYKICDAVYFAGQGSDFVDATVVVGSDTVVVGTDTVVSPKLSTLAESNASIVLLVNTGSGMTMATFSDETFYDWGDNDYTSYAETGYDFVGDTVLKKSAPYLVTYCRVTEEGWLDGSPIRPSSLLVSAYWDFSKSAATSAQQAYRYKKTPVDTGNLTDFGYPDTVITTRLKVRGSGRSMRLRFESEEGKDFILIGYGVVQGANGRF